MTLELTKIYQSDIPNVVVILGNSRSGKDTIADYLDKEYFYTAYHVLEDYYAFLEDYFAIGSSIRNNSEAKQKVLPGTGGVTLGEMLVSLYHWTIEQGINWTEINFDRVTGGIGSSKVFTGVRNMHEAIPLVKNSFDFYKDETRYHIHTFLVERPGASGYTSDKNLKEIAAYLERESDSFTTINNNGTLPELYATIDSIVEQLGLGLD